MTQTTRYLADDGLLAFIVPRQRLAVSVRYLSTHYGRMQCWAFPDPERQVFDQVVLFGYRKTDPVPDALGDCPRKTLFAIRLTHSEYIRRPCNANRTIAQCALCTSLVSENTQTHS